MYNPFNQPVTYNPFEFNQEPVTIHHEPVIIPSPLLGGEHTDIWYS